MSYQNTNAHAGLGLGCDFTGTRQDTAVCNLSSMKGTGFPYLRLRIAHLALKVFYLVLGKLFQSNAAICQ